MIKKYKLLRIKLDEGKIKNKEPIDVDVASQSGYKSSMSLTIKSFWEKDGIFRFSFKYPASNPLHRSYMFGYFNLALNTGEIIIYKQ